MRRPPHVVSPERDIQIPRKKMKLVGFWLEVNVVILIPSEKTIEIAQQDIDRQESKKLLRVDKVIKSLREILIRAFVDQPREIDHSALLHFRSGGLRYIRFFIGSPFFP